MNNSPDELPRPEQVAYLWSRVQVALLANGNPAGRQIDRMAAVVGEELAATTVDGWFKTWSVVPEWGKFHALVKALGAERDEDWRALHQAALTADRRRKQEMRRKKNADSDIPVSAPPDPADSNSPEVAATGVRVRVLISVAAVAAIIGVAGTLLAVNSSLSADGGGPAEGRYQSNDVPHCASVMADIAAVYSAPDASSKKIKYKNRHDKITLSNHSDPAGWWSVQTPYDAPGYHWMQAADLTTPAPCFTG